MRKENQKNRTSRRKFLQQAAMLSSGLILPATISAAFDDPTSANRQGPLKAVVLGDSAMWGQGLNKEDKYSTKSVAAIGSLLGREATIETNFSHSGAAISSTKQQRKAFANKYPARFAWTDFSHGATTKLAEDFINEQDEGPTMIGFYGEIPSTFPTISYQVARVPDSVARNAELLLINGGANDLSFEDFLNPLEHRDDFVHVYHDLIKEYTYTRVSALLKFARKKFPNAVIIYTGYFSPFYPDTSNDAIRNLFYHLKGVSHFKARANKIFNYQNPPQLVKEAQYRSQFGLTQGLYWTRKAVAELNNDPETKGPGILYINPHFKPRQSVFAGESCFFKNYKTGDIRDAAKNDRWASIPRIDKEEELKAVLRAAVPPAHMPVNEVQRLLQNLDGSKDLVVALKQFLAQKTVVNILKMRKAVQDELDRIDHDKIASFLHPNESGAQVYTNEIVARYKDRLHQVRISRDLQQFQNVPGSTEADQLNNVMRRYGLEKYNTAPANASQLMPVDSIALEIRSASSSERRMFDNLYLKMGDQYRWQLNFPYEYIAVTNLYIKRLHNQFNPGFTDFFTVDGGGMHLSSITEFTLEREKIGSSPFAGSGSFVIAEVILYLNGIKVFTSSNVTSLQRDRSVSYRFPYT